MAKRKRRAFTKEFKAQAVRIVRESGKSVAAVAARRNRPMGEVVDELVDRELAELANLWTSPEGLLLQQAVLASVWDDPALDVYDED
jgi:hypothetical protein